MPAVIERDSVKDTVRLVHGTFVGVQALGVAYSLMSDRPFLPEQLS